MHRPKIAKVLNLRKCRGLRRGLWSFLMPDHHIGVLHGGDRTIFCIFLWTSKFNLKKSRQKVTYLQKFLSDAGESMKMNRLKLRDLIFVKRSSIEAFEHMNAQKHHLIEGAKVFSASFSGYGVAFGVWECLWANFAT